MKIDEGFLAAMEGDNSIVRDLKVPPRQVAPQSVEELFATPYEYETKAPLGWNLRGFYNPEYRGKFYYDNKPRKELTRHHEAEHVLSAMMPFSGKSPRVSKFNINSRETAGINGSQKNEPFTSTAGFMGALANRMDDIKKRFPEVDHSVYMEKDFIRNAGYNSRAFDEVMATLAAMEKHYNIDFLKDPMFKDIFTKPGAYQAYRSLTGLRQTITDPKDIPAQSVDTGKEWYSSPLQKRMNPTMLQKIKDLLK
jgi:hypothetical protein